MRLHATCSESRYSLSLSIYILRIFPHRRNYTKLKKKKKEKNNVREREKKKVERKNWKEKYKRSKKRERGRADGRGTRSICSKACNAEAVNGAISRVISASRLLKVGQESATARKLLLFAAGRVEWLFRKLAAKLEATDGAGEKRIAGSGRSSGGGRSGSANY